VRLGSIKATGETVASGESDAIAIQTGVPYFKRYFLGGATSLRGWGRYEVSPLNSEGFPIGGLTSIEFAEELRFPIRGPLTGVAFVEGGAVAEDSWDFPIADLRYDAGAGIRYLTPIGPVRFDIGYQINPIPGLKIDGELQERRWRMHFSVGQAF
jgi:outer membrane protein insertion porin family/translocation and assembly module TamA